MDARIAEALTSSAFLCTEAQGGTWILFCTRFLCFVVFPKMFWLICDSTDCSRLPTHRVNSRRKDASMLVSKSFIRAVSLDDKQHHSICWIPSYIHAGNPSGRRNKMRILSLKSNGDISAKFRNLHLFFNPGRSFINALLFFIFNVADLELMHHAASTDALISIWMLRLTQK